MKMRRKGSVYESCDGWHAVTPDRETFGPFADRHEALAVLHPRAAFWAFRLFWVGILVLVALLSMKACGQTPAASTWFTVVPAGQQSKTITITLQSGMVYRFGDTRNNRWTDALTASAVPAQGTVTISDFDDGLNGDPPDPDPSVAKEFDVQETSSVQTVTLTDSSTASATITTVTVPALQPPPPPPSTTATFIAGTVYPVTLSSIQPVPDSLAAVLLQRIPLSPNLVLQGVLSGFSFKLAINGVTLTCLTGAATPNGTVTLSCD